MTFPAPEYPAQFRTVLGHFATGIAVVTAMDGREPVGMTIQSFCSLSLEPPLILLCPGRGSTSWPRIEPAGRCCINLLAEGQERVARQFARSGSDKYAGVGWHPSPETGSPMLEGAIAWIDCTVESIFPGGDHLIVVCRALDLAARTDLRPLIFFQSGFGRIAVAAR
jgi:3-hydroxy-9,10-secoandrosta-1,3,5(10)-triene-9,17-dione monooxygenase reductase component